jgi:hypothetical protein
MARKVRSDIKVGNLEKRLGVSPGTITNADGSDARSDKKLGTLRKEYAKAKQKVATNKTKSKTKVLEKSVKVAASSITTADQKTASKRRLKPNPKTSLALVSKVSAALRKTKSKK